MKHLFVPLYAAMLLGLPPVPTAPALLEPAAAAASTLAPPLVGGPEDWLNTNGQALSLHQGKVYLVDFWEYTCVNCIRTLPYLKAWHERYAKDGLVIVGVHTPEFAFAGVRANVAAAVERFGLAYPVLIDSDYRNWRAWQGESGYWPRKFLVDARGQVVYDHAGEGGYGETEARIQQVLRQAHPGIRLPVLLQPIRPEDKPGAVCYPMTPEMYAGARGFEQGQHGSLAGSEPGRVVSASAPRLLDDGKFYLEGLWRTETQSLRHARTTTGLTDFITVRYHALTCNAVVKPESGPPFRLYVTQDGRPVPHQDAGEDLHSDEAGRTYALVSSPRMYRLTKNRAFGAHVLRLAADSDGFGLYSLTFTSCTAP